MTGEIIEENNNNNVEVIIPQKPPGKFIEVLGQIIHYEELGSGPEVLLMIPGAIGSTRSDFSPQLDQDGGLDRDEFTIIAIDLPGYGYSRPPERDHNVRIYHQDAEIAAALMEQLGHRRYSVLGWSDGGKAALMIAASHPGKVNKLVIWGTLIYGTDAVVHAVTRTRDLSLWNKDLRGNYERVYGVDLFHNLWDKHLKWCERFFNSAGEWDARPDLGKIKCPTLVLHGDMDPLTEPCQLQAALDGIPDATCHRYPTGSHSIHQEFTEDFNERVKEFLID